MARRDTNQDIIRVCYVCGNNETYRNHWYSNLPIGWLCSRCNMKYITNPKWHPITNPIYGKRHLEFKGKIILVKEPPRIGVCNWCRAIKGQINAQIDQLCRVTHVNHESYHDDDMLRDALELCARCHRKYHLEK